MTHENILIVDFGSQVTKLIARRVREAGVYSEIVPFQNAKDALERMKPMGIILSGGPCSVSEKDAPKADMSLFEAGVPVLGICYGQQLMALQLGGAVEAGHTREFGRSELSLSGQSKLFDGVLDKGETTTVWMSHGDHVSKLPAGFGVVATSRGAPFAAISDEARRFYGVQFHPEVVHTALGAQILSHFVRGICGCAGDWSMRAYREEAIEKIKQQVGDAHVICALSGGVDSAVAAKLIYDAIGKQLTCVLVDHGFMRAGEAKQIATLFDETFHIPLIVVDATKRFFDALQGNSEPERKRKIIGGLFIDVFEEEAKKIENVKFLAQGTIYPDVIESAAVPGVAATIKSHHNVGGLPARMNLSLVEPLRELFKDEVRTLGLELGLPQSFLGRHPFPGPGLAIRVLGDLTPERVETARQADRIFIEEIRAEGLYDSIWQAFAALLPVRSVGVMGDGRTYEETIALRAVTSIDGMTADMFHFEGAFLARIATRIINEVKGVNRVVYDITSKPPATIEWE